MGSEERGFHSSNLNSIICNLFADFSFSLSRLISQVTLIGSFQLWCARLCSYARVCSHYLPKSLPSRILKKPEPNWPDKQRGRKKTTDQDIKSARCTQIHTDTHTQEFCHPNSSVEKVNFKTQAINFFREFGARHTRDDTVS